MVSRCHSRVWCVGLGLAHPQVVANQNHPRSFSKAPQGPHNGWGSALALGSEDMVILPPQQHQEGHADKAHCQKKKKKSSLSEPLVNIYKVQKNTKLSFSFPIRTWVSQTAPSIYFSTPLPSFPVLALPWHCPLMGKALIQDRQLPAPLRKANADPSVLQTRSFRKQPILLLILITSCKLKAWEKKAECQRIEGLELWSCRRL